MRKVVFLKVVIDNNIVYPDDISFFSNVEDYDDENLVADYTGVNDEIETAPPQVIEWTVISISTSLPQINVTEFSNSSVDEHNDITCSVGSTLTIDISANMDMNGSFRIPFKNETTTKYFFGDFINGESTFTGVIDNSGLWVIDDEELNNSMKSNSWHSINILGGSISVYVVK